MYTALVSALSRAVASRTMLSRTVGKSRVAEISRLTSTRAAVSSLRRTVSSYSRALSMAVATFAAMVASRRLSASPNRPSSWVLWTLRTPIASSPAMIGTPRYERASVPTPRVPTAAKCSSRLRRSGSRLSMIRQLSPRPRGRGGGGSCSPSST